jgi:predicted RNA binding protein YcfA (HicA-like mRNA interferase family)
MFNLQARSEENTNTERHQVLETRSYSMFKHMAGNRALNEQNIRSIMHQIQHYGQQQPIIVNERYEVIDGQHRLEACKRLKKPVIFYKKKGARIQHVITTNAVGRKWTLLDHFNRFAAEGNENYARGLEFIKHAKKFGFSQTAAIAMMRGSHVQYVMCDDGVIRANSGRVLHEKKAKVLYPVGNAMQLGYFQCPSQKELQEVLQSIQLFEKFGFSKTKTFVAALLRVMRVDEFEVERLKERALRYPSMFTHEPDSKHYLQMFDKVYNYRSKTKLALMHLA